VEAYSLTLTVWKAKNSGTEIKVLTSHRVQTNYKSISGSRYEHQFFLEKLLGKKTPPNPKT